MKKHSMRGWLSAIGCTAALLGCRVGGGPADGETGDDTSDGSTGADTGAPAADSSSGTSTPDTSTAGGDDAGADGTTPQGDGSSASDAHSDAHLSDGALSDAPVIGPPNEAGTCTPTFTPLICDPVCNTGCSGLTRCDVSDTANTGACIGIWIQGEGSACLPKTASTDPCAANLSCVNGVCVRLCYHDSDCTTAKTCCNTTVPNSTGASGFKSCGACP